MEEPRSADPKAGGTNDTPWKCSGRGATETSLTPHPHTAPESLRQGQQVSDQAHLVQCKEYDAFEALSLRRLSLLHPRRCRVADSHQMASLRRREGWKPTEQQSLFALVEVSLERESECLGLKTVERRRGPLA